MKPVLSMPCIQAGGGRTKNGYARATIAPGRRALAHRVAYERVNGPIPPGLVLDHLCHTFDPDCEGGDPCLHRGCVEPTHLQAVPQATNVQRGGYSRKTHCKHGHPFSGENLIPRTDGRGRRRCRACAEARSVGRRGAPKAWWFQAADLYRTGHSTLAIGRQIGRDPSAVWRGLSKLGVELRPQVGGIRK